MKRSLAGRALSICAFREEKKEVTTNDKKDRKRRDCQMCSQGLEHETPGARPGPAPCTGSQSAMDILRAVSSIHCHKNQSDEMDVDVSARRRLICASVLCLTFMLIELIGGILANSLAIATDAAHLLTDFASFMISLFSLWMGARPATKRLSFGWYRAEVIGALTSVIMIWAVTGVLVYMAIQRVISKEYNIDATIMLISASVGVVVNIIMGLALQIHPTGAMGHSHGSEESARRFDLPSTEPFVPQGATASEMDSSRQFSHLNVFRSASSRSALGSGSVNAMSPPYLSIGENVPAGGGGAYSASAPSITSPPYYAHGADAASETPAQHTSPTTPDGAAVDTVSPQEGTAEQSPAEGTSGAQQVVHRRLLSTMICCENIPPLPRAISSNPEENTRSEAKERSEGGAGRTVPSDAQAVPNSTATSATVDGPAVIQHDLGTPSDGRSDVGSLDNGNQQQAAAAGAAIGRLSSQPLLSSEEGAADPSPDPPMRKDTRGVMNINVRAAFIHVVGDLIQSVGVLIAAIVIYFCPSCGVVDPVCTLMFSVIVLVTTLAILREALNVLMEGIPHSIDYHQVKRLLLSVDGVARVHDLHIWALSLDKLAVSAHVVLVPGADAMSVRRNASRTIRRNVDVFKLTLQMEEFEEGIRQHCRRCSELS
ncbi:putative proton-coupled zinc antiporter SLC30A3 [Amblyomma americanum]